MPEIEKAGSLKTNWLSLSFPSIAITKYSYEQGDRLTYTPEQGYDLSHDRAFGYKDRIHRGVFRLEPDMVTELAVQDTTELIASAAILSGLSRLFAEKLLLLKDKTLETGGSI